MTIDLEATGPLDAIEKAAVQRILIRCGKYDAFCLARDKHRHEAGRCGVSREGSVTLGWRNAMEDFQEFLEGPVEVGVEELPEEEEPEEPLSAETEERFKSAPLDVQADVQEAYEKLGQPGLKVNVFDRPGAWEFYQFATKHDKNREAFLKDFVVKFLHKEAKDKDDGKEGWSEKDIELVSLLEAMTEECPAQMTVKCPYCDGHFEVDL